jgi:hypothetical protein
MYFYSLPEPYFMKADQMAFEAEVRNQFERMTEMLNQLLQGSNVNNNGTQSLDPPSLLRRQLCSSATLLTIKDLSGT